MGYALFRSHGESGKRKADFVKAVGFRSACSRGA